jgi:hypothetical protein
MEGLKKFEGLVGQKACSGFVWRHKMEENGRKEKIRPDQRCAEERTRSKENKEIRAETCRNLSCLSQFNLVEMMYAVGRVRSFADGEFKDGKRESQSVLAQARALEQFNTVT